MRTVFTQVDYLFLYDVSVKKTAIYARITLPISIMSINFISIGRDVATISIPITENYVEVIRGIYITMRTTKGATPLRVTLPIIIEWVLQFTLRLTLYGSAIHDS